MTDSLADDEVEVVGEAPWLKAGGTNVRVLPDGALRPMRAETFALAIAEGYGPNEAWQVSGGGAHAYRVRIEKHAVFRVRVGMLKLEKEKSEVDGVSGEVLWAARQNWRLARASGDIAQIHRATTLLIQTHKDVGSIGSAPEGGEGVKPEGPGPGRPAHQPRATRPDVGSMKTALLERGRAVPQAVAPVAAVQ